MSDDMDVFDMRNLLRQCREFVEMRSEKNCCTNLDGKMSGRRNQRSATATATSKETNELGDSPRESESIIRRCAPKTSNHELEGIKRRASGVENEEQTFRAHQ